MYVCVFVDCVFVTVYFRSFQGVWLHDILASDSGSGTLLIKLDVLSQQYRFFSLVKQYHTHEFLIWPKSKMNPKNEDEFEHYLQMKTN